MPPCHRRARAASTLAWSALLLASAATVLPGQTPAPPTVVAGIPVNYDEALTGTYTLPDLFVLADGTAVRDATTWTTSRRPEIVRLLEHQQFGRSPGRPADLRFEIFDKGTPALNGIALRRQVTIVFSSAPGAPTADLLIYLPANARGPVPLLLNISFSANSAVVDDPGIRPGTVWDREKNVRVPATPRPQGRLDIAPFLAQGIGVATMYYGDIEPDFAAGLPLGIRKHFLKPGQTQPAADEWGTIAAWAWGLSRAMDYLETDTAVDAHRVAIVGVSRLGKTVLWAGARDTRFAMVIASCSGESGAALSRRTYGETVKHMTARYGYQFAANYAHYGDRIDTLPVDAHMLVASIAPRPLLLQTGDKDFWSDPRGEFLAAVAAGPVYTLLGKGALGTNEMPAAGIPIFQTIGYVMHEGGHGTIASDWPLFLQFMRMHLLPDR
ncbi:hypothetical protein LuPra_01331 [Luteitalea pratensis]|uniref:4-O-methyl-glucuronoyl methylesterase-like domain-containing protein n=1 Tax=Luteitalea pratensis TaxID=1855912 RepID=A0A143PIR5_LUTPR|nr:prolyl oligopeptidase family serine peptidase [Luteitalea pratensis]AMY08143.1 hypothetical protein LuPra_01331 [Luteitalea pratensis]